VTSPGDTCYLGENSFSVHDTLIDASSLLRDSPCPTALLVKGQLAALPCAAT
jgi:hypothetical protein